MPRYPTLYQINTRVHLNRLGRELGHPATLDDLGDEILDLLAAHGFDWLYLLGVWSTGPLSRRLALQNPGLQAELSRVLPDLSIEDICGSCFAIAGYHGADMLGGDGALLRLRERLHARGIKLMLDFIPNHVGVDHPWAWQHPEYFVQGDEGRLRLEPQNYIRIAIYSGDLILAHGRDPNFDGWSDTLQLNYANPALQQAMTGELMRAASLCDGLRCDMAMLLQPEVFERTWGLRAEPFWPRAIRAVRQAYPEFTFMAEVYWDQEFAMLAQGFDFCYDKGFYDALLSKETRGVNEHILERSDYQDHLARFLENHDEPRAALVFSDNHHAGNERHKAAAVLAYTLPGLRFFHEGQLDGWKVKLPMQLCRGPQQTVDYDLIGFYTSLLATLSDTRFKEGYWDYHLIHADGDSAANPPQAIAYSWSPAPGMNIRIHDRLLCVVNYSPRPGRFFVRLEWDDLHGSVWRFTDRLSSYSAQIDGDVIASHGLPLDMPPWGRYIFSITQES
jgi:hypothetical protein